MYTAIPAVMILPEQLTGYSISKGVFGLLYSDRKKWPYSRFSHSADLLRDARYDLYK